MSWLEESNILQAYLKPVPTNNNWDNGNGLKITFYSQTHMFPDCPIPPTSRWDICLNNPLFDNAWIILASQYESYRKIKELMDQDLQANLFVEPASPFHNGEYDFEEIMARFKLYFAGNGGSPPFIKGNGSNGIPNELKNFNNKQKTFLFMFGGDTILLCSDPKYQGRIYQLEDTHDPCSAYYRHNIDNMKKEAMAPEAPELSSPEPMLTILREIDALGNVRRIQQLSGSNHAIIKMGGNHLTGIYMEVLNQQLGEFSYFENTVFFRNDQVTKQQYGIPIDYDIDGQGRYTGPNEVEDQQMRMAAYSQGIGGSVGENEIYQWAQWFRNRDRNHITIDRSLMSKPMGEYQKKVQTDIILMVISRVRVNEILW